ncbi:hypothetical protein A0257_15260 [Hymenobacter psoromatis]|nr:hypothetical protein A0257_15260 [Hymenobacter psoromatis]
MAKIGSSQPPPSPLGGRRIAGAGAASPTPLPEPVPQFNPSELAQRLENATLTGPLLAVPAAYEHGSDWETLLADNVFTQLYLTAALHAQVSDAQVAANQRVLAAFWEQKLRLLNAGNQDLEDVYRPGTVTKAQGRLQAAAAALADAAGRAACFAELSRRRHEAAAQKTDGYLRLLLQSPVLTPTMLRLAATEGVASGFTLSEAETYLLQKMRAAAYAPVKTLNQSPNLLLADWTPGGVPLTNRPHTKVLGQDVYSLAEAGQLLYEAFTADDERVKRDLLSANFLGGIADDLKERSTGQDLREITQDLRLNQDQKRLSALYLLGPSLPFYLGKTVPAFTSPAQLLTRAADSARDFAAAEEAFKQKLLPLWLRAAATAEVKAALPGPGQAQALDFRRFLHAANPRFPLWIGEQSFTSLAQLAYYIRRDEFTWKMVYGSLTAGNFGPWLATLNQSGVLERQAQLASTLRGPGLEPDSERGRQLAVQALLETIEPQAAPPTLAADLSSLDLTGLSGEALAERPLTLTNTTGGPVRVFLSLVPALEGVQLSATELYFDQRAPGQQLSVRLTGNPTQMPRDGRHQAQLKITTVYTKSQLPVVAEAVFPVREFLLFVGGAALALGAALGSIRFLLGELLGEENYQHFLARGTLLPFDRAEAAVSGTGGVFLLALALLGGVGYLFVSALRRLAKTPAAR